MISILDVPRKVATVRRSRYQFGVYVLRNTAVAIDTPTVERYIERQGRYVVADLGEVARAYILAGHRIASTTLNARAKPNCHTAIQIGIQCSMVVTPIKPIASDRTPPEVERLLITTPSADADRCRNYYVSRSFR